MFEPDIAYIVIIEAMAASFNCTHNVTVIEFLGL